VTEVALTLLDVLDDFDEIKVCTGYRLRRIRGESAPGGSPVSGRQHGYSVSDEAMDYPPSTLEAWESVTPVYETLPGWRQPTTGARAPEDLPALARGYVSFLADALGGPVTMVGVGPSREQLVPFGAEGGTAVLAG
jgi:adenylosuccinate synthase